MENIYKLINQQNNHDGFHLCMHDIQTWTETATFFLTHKKL